MRGQLGVRGVGCLRGKRSWWGILGYYFKMLLWRWTWKIDGFRDWRHLPFILFVMLIIFWMFSLLLIMWCMCRLSGIRIFLWRLCCLLGICFVIGYLLRTAFIVNMLLILMLRRASEGTVWWKLLLTYYIVLFFGSVWFFIFRWLGISTVMPFDVACHFNKFNYIGGAAKSQRSILQVIWFEPVWKIWKERNNKIFNDNECTIMQVVDKIKSIIFMWLKAKFALLPFNYHGWWLSPFTMLGIGYLLFLFCNVYCSVLACKYWLNFVWILVFLPRHTLCYESLFVVVIYSILTS